jgi:hypothetical protein
MREFISDEHRVSSDGHAKQERDLFPCPVTESVQAELQPLQFEAVICHNDEMRALHEKEGFKHTADFGGRMVFGHSDT